MTEDLISSPVGLALRYMAGELVKMAKIAAKEAGVTPEEVLKAYMEAIKNTYEYQNLVEG